jgi:hypothetical protein
MHLVSSNGTKESYSDRCSCVRRRGTLVDETREYGIWADWLGIPRHTFSAVLGAVIALGMDYRDAFQYFRPGFSLDAERARRADAGQPE